MRILHVIHGLTTGGAEMDLLNKAIYLAKHRGLESTVCCLMRRGDLALQFERAGIKVIGPLMKGRYDVAAGTALRALLAKPGWDIVHAHICAANLITWAVWATLPSARRPPLVVREAAMADYWPAWVLKLDKMMMRSTHRMIVPSRAMAEDYSAAGISHEKIRLVHNGVDLRPFLQLDREAARRVIRQELTLSEDDFVVGTVCRLNPVKNLSLLIDAVDGLPVHLVIAGEGSGRANLEMQIAKCSRPDRVHLIGHRTDIPELLSAFDLFVLASQYESFGRSALEALAAQVPVIASDVGGLREVTGDGNFATLVTPGNVLQLRDAIKQAIETMPAARAVTLEGREHVRKRFSVEAGALALHRIYLELA